MNSSMNYGLVVLSVLVLRSVNAQTQNQVAKFDDTGTPVDSAITEGDGRVGVGITSPQARLHIPGTAWFSGDDTPLPGAAGTGVAIGYGGVGYLFAFDYGTFTSKDLAIQSPGGNVAIGTTTPTQKLHVAGNAVVYGRVGIGMAPYPPGFNIGLALSGGLYVANTGPNFAGDFQGSGPNGYGVRINTAAGVPALVVYGGTKSGVVATTQGMRGLYTEESSEVWFTDYGFGRLQSKAAHVEIDPLFAQTVNLDEPYHVFVQAYGDAELYVSQRTAKFFEIRWRAGEPDVEFSYRIVAKRRGYEHTRLQPMPDDHSVEQKGNATVDDHAR